MIFIPKKFKHKKFQKGTFPNKFNALLKFENFQVYNSLRLIALEFGSLSTKQLVAIRFLIKKFTKKKGFIRFKVFPNQGISKKPLEIRMGKGKGNLSHWITKIKVGTIICEIFYKKKHKHLILCKLKKLKVKIPLNTVIKDN